MGSFQNVITGHDVDHMWPKSTSVFATKFRVSQNIMLCIETLSYNVVETTLGVSQGRYLQASLIFSHIGGMVQGKAMA